MGSPREGSLVGGRYRLARFIGAGARGEVYDAQGPDDTHVAVKVLTTPHDPERFEREVTATTRLKNPFVVPIIDHGVDDDTGTPFLVMPLLRGRGLDEILRERAPINPAGTVLIGVDIATALEEAHAAGLVHRDVKPSNIMIDEQVDGTLRARLCDFGLARVSDALTGLTATGTPLGTPMYMSPEQSIDAKRVDARADVWGLAVTLYHALTGRPPLHDAKNHREWLRRLADQEVPPIVESAPWVDEKLAQAVHRGLEREPSNRYAGASEFLAALLSLGLESDSLTWDLLTTAKDARDPVGSPRAETSDSVRGERLSESQDPFLDSTLDGKYRLRRQLGAGGMGAVYEAVTGEGEQYAVKVIRPDIASESSDALKRFVREARAAMTIDSEYVVKVVGASTDASRGVPYIVMELLRGQDLAAVVDRHGALDPGAAAWIFHRACKGLGAAHATGMTHRDIKPANIFLHELEDGSIIPKLCDFGIAKQEESFRQHASTGLTETGGLLGSPLYMSPEQAENAKRADARSDVWSVGVSLYEALCGHRPWADCSTIGELLRCLYTEDVPPIQNTSPWVEPELAAVVHRALRRRPEERFPTAVEFAEALAPFAESGALPRESIAAVSDERRSIQAPRLDPALFSTSPNLSAGRSVGDAHEAAAPSRAWVGFAIAGALVLGGLGYVAFRSSTPELHLAADSTPSGAVAPSAEPALVTATLEVRPSNAKVTVDGVPAAVKDGRLHIKREPGKTARVVVELDGRRADEQVVVTHNGTTMPSVIELPAASASVAPEPVAAPRRGGAQPAHKKPEASTPTAPAPPAKSSPNAPRFKTTW